MSISSFLCSLADLPAAHLQYPFSHSASFVWKDLNEAHLHNDNNMSSLVPINGVVLLCILPKMSAVSTFGAFV